MNYQKKNDSLNKNESIGKFKGATLSYDEDCSKEDIKIIKENLSKFLSIVNKNWEDILKDCYEKRFVPMDLKYLNLKDYNDFKKKFKIDTDCFAILNHNKKYNELSLDIYCELKSSTRIIPMAIIIDWQIGRDNIIWDFDGSD